jgi:hypothetical protein
LDAAGTGTSGNGGTGNDTDGLDNLSEFAFGLNPNVNDAVALTVTNGSSFTVGTQVVNLQFSGGTQYNGRFVRRKDYAAAGLTYTPQFSADMVTWQNSSATPTTVATSSSSPCEVVQIPYLQFLSNGKKARHFRMTVSITP